MWARNWSITVPLLSEPPKLTKQTFIENLDKSLLEVTDVEESKSWRQNTTKIKVPLGRSDAVIIGLCSSSNDSDRNRELS